MVAPAAVLVSLPCGAPKGIRFNHAVVVVGDPSTRLDDVLSDLDEHDGGDPRAERRSPW